MPGSKRKIDEDTWIVSQSKKFKQGYLLSSVYETTLAHLRMGARQFFNSLLGAENQTEGMMEGVGTGTNALSSPSSSPPHGTPTASPYNTPPGSPVVRDIISENELQNVAAAGSPRPAVICQDCAIRVRNPLLRGGEDSFGKCAYCEKLVCHLNTCRGCSSDFCRDCSIAKYDDSIEAYECYSCLH